MGRILEEPCPACRRVNYVVEVGLTNEAKDFACRGCGATISIVVSAPVPNCDDETSSRD